MTLGAAAGLGQGLPPVLGEDKKQSAGNTVFSRQFDVIVCGAGVAGIAAALEASRAGLRTALIEKSITPGGLGTSGLVYAYPPLCDANGRQVTYGIAEELLYLTFRYGPGRVDGEWRDISTEEYPTRSTAWVKFSPASFVLALDEELTAAGISVWFDTLVCRPIMEGDRVVGVEAETKGGRGAFTAQCVIDATGDADVAHSAGVPCEPGRNSLAMWAIQASLEAARTAVELGTGLPLEGLLQVRQRRDATGAHGSGGSGRAWSGLDAEEITAFVLASRASLREHYAELHEMGGANQRYNIYPLTLPTMPQFTMVRRIVGRTNLTGDEHSRHQPDSIGLVADWRRLAPVWEIPYGALLPTQVRGLLAAGRCIASGGEAWQVTRIMHAAALTGQAAGIAATLAVRGDTTPDLVGSEMVQEQLRKRGIPLHLEDVPGLS